MKTLGHTEAADVWVCRRVVDYAPAPVPPHAAVDTCAWCSALVAYNPARPVDAPRVCMQCAGIEPLPITPADR